MSMNRERYVIRTRWERDRGLSLIRKTRQSTRKFLPWGKGKSVQARDPFPVPTTAGVDPWDPWDSRDPDSRSIAFVTYRGNQWVLRTTLRRNAKGARAATTCPSWRHAQRMSSPENLPWATDLNGCMLPRILPILIFNVNNLQIIVISNCFHFLFDLFTTRMSKRTLRWFQCSWNLIYNCVVI